MTHWFRLAGVWDDVFGQDRAVALLQRAAGHPVHSYLLVGPRGSGVEEAARAFAGALVLGDDADEGAIDRVRRGRHPDVVEFEPTGASYSVVDDIRRRIIPTAFQSPVEAEHRVLILWEAERLRGQRDESQNALLKTIEEPPERTHLLLVTDAPNDLLITVRSRCQRIDFSALGDDQLRRALRDADVPDDVVETAVRLAGGRLDRARAFAGPRLPLRNAFVDAVVDLGASGAAVLRAAESMAAAVADDQELLTAELEVEATELDAEIERSGYPDRTAGAMRKRLADDHRRRLRRSRVDALIEGITTLESVYRDALAPDAQPRNPDRPRLRVDARAAAEAIDACRVAREALVEHNPNEALLLERLVFALPTGAVAADG
ncbi:MAG: hypothetical protein R3A49_13185 [Acidimicrobiia bacterium]